MKSKLTYLAISLTLIGFCIAGIVGIYPTPCGAPTMEQAKKALSQQRFGLQTIDGQPLDGVVPNVFRFEFSAQSWPIVAAAYNLPANLNAAGWAEMLAAKGVQLRVLNGADLTSATRVEATMDAARYDPCPSGTNGLAEIGASASVPAGVSVSLAVLLAVMVMSRRRPTNVQEC